MIRPISIVMLLLMLAANSSGDDWLEGGYVGRDYGEIRQYFTDPIFQVRVPISSPIYPYKGGSFREPLVLGRYTSRLAYQSPANMSFYYPYAWQSEFRSRSLAGMQWETFQKNWTSTLIYASTRSSMRVKEGGVWRGL